MKIEQKKTLTEECWIKLEEGDTPFEVRIDYPVFPHNATISKLSIDESIGRVASVPSWAFYVQSVVKDYRGAFSEDGKEYHPTIEKNLLSTKDFNILLDMGYAELIYMNARKELDFSETDKKKL